MVDLEVGNPPSILKSGRLQVNQKLLGHVQFATLCGSLFLAGWNDGSSGPLLPRIQKVYNVNFTIVSLIFVCSCSVCLASVIHSAALSSNAK